MNALIKMHIIRWRRSWWDQRQTPVISPSVVGPWFIEALRPLLAAKSRKLNGSLFNYPCTYLGKIEAYFQIKFSRACVNHFLRMRCHMKGKIMDIKAMIFFFAKDCRKSPKNSPKIVICACKWKFGSTTFHCSNSVMHELWTLNCLSNERREAYLSIPFMYISLRKFMIMIAKNYIEFRFRLFWDTLYSDNQSPTSDNHLFWVVAGGCQRSANVCRWSPTSRRLVVKELHRQPPADLRQPLFFWWFSVVGKWLSMIADQSAIGRRLVVGTACRREVFVAASKTFRQPTSRRNFLNIVWSATVLRSIGDQSPISLQWLPIIFSG